MARQSQQVLIVDNATTCAMRIKTLVNIHGAEATIVHWSSWEEKSLTLHSLEPCLVVIEESVPSFIAEQVAVNYKNKPIFILIGKGSMGPEWALEYEITPIANSLSNVELVTLLEPYWAEDKVMSVPNVVILDRDESCYPMFAREFSRSSIPFQLLAHYQAGMIENLDVLMISAKIIKNQSQLLKEIGTFEPDACLLVYGEPEDFSEIAFMQAMVSEKVKDIINTASPDGWFGRFSRIWQAHVKEQETLLIAKQVQLSLDKLLEKNLFMQALVANAQDGVIAFDEDGQLIKFNDGFCELIGIVHEQAVNANIFDWLSRQGWQDLKDLLNKEVWVQQQVLELQLIHEHQVPIAVSFALNCINSNGKRIYIAVIRNNVNQQFQKTYLVQKNAQLEHQIKEVNRQKQLSIELNNKVERKRNNFFVYLNTFIQQLLNQESQYRSEGLTSKLENLITFFKLESNQLQYLPAELMLEGELVRILAKCQGRIDHRNLDVSLQVPFGGHLYVNSQQFEHIMVELIDNVCLYAHESSNLTITVKTQSELFIELHIQDEGPGILDHEQLHIFDLYESNNKFMPHSSIKTGLPIVKRLVQFNHGEVYIDNHYKNHQVVGTEVVLKLPIKST